MMNYSKIALAISFIFLSSCQIGYLIRTSYDHLAMLTTKIPVEKALQLENLSAEQKRKIALTQEIRQFSFDSLGLNKSENYTQYVQLDRPYITYAVMASYKWKFESYLWDFPFIGKAPYKGYYNEKSAQQEAQEMKSKDFDVYVRGVPAYSTLGKLTDPLLSSMLTYKEHDLVNTIIHELVHTTLFIKSNIDFNERLAVFVANKGTELFYINKEGPTSKTVGLIQQENADDTLFSEFITKELDEIKIWYKNFDATSKVSADDKEKIRQERLNLIKIHFTEKLAPLLKTKSYSRFKDGEFNNASLGTYQTYMKDLSDFEKVYTKNGKSIPAFLTKCKELNAATDPEAELKKWASE